MSDIRLMVARELNKIAKELVAVGEVANQPGEYKNFTGTIDWNGTKGQVKNANFRLKNDGVVYFDKGTWVNGVWNGGIFFGDTWEDGIWYGGNDDSSLYGKLHLKGDSPDKWGK